MKIYKIVRHNHVVATVNGKPLRHIVLYSPTGFYFSHRGHGQLDLAVSILADYFGEDPTKEQLFYDECQCCLAHEDFKQNFLDVQHGDSFTISEEEIKLWYAQRRKRI
ncbi:MAG: hypothetical protein E2O87_00330 [Bacteroidetes bacterium]|nr:MAG: hypothetical protein E2O87_00330 [Bacteroidota bacterium]